MTFPALSCAGAGAVLGLGWDGSVVNFNAEENNALQVASQIGSCQLDNSDMIILLDFYFEN